MGVAPRAWSWVCLLLVFPALGLASDWPVYRHDPQGSANPGEPLATSQATSFQQVWSAPLGIIGNPVVANGRMFVTSTDGALHALDLSTGQELWRHASNAYGPFLCQAGSTSSNKRGPVGAPAVVGSTVFMPGGDGVVYAHDAATGTILWQTPIADVGGKNEFLWSSAYPLGSRVYVGVGSLEDCVLVPGRVVALDQATGAVVGTWWGDSGYGGGGGIWTQPAYDAATGRLFITTGNVAQGLSPSQQSLAQAIVAIDPVSMATLDHYQPVSGDYYADMDFGASPTLYDTPDGRHWIAAVNKDGWVYALDRDNLAGGVIWAYQIAGFYGDPDMGLSTIVSPTFAHGSLFVAGTKTPDGYSGSVAALDPGTGIPKWVWHLPNNEFVLGALTSVGDTLLVSGTQTVTGTGSLDVLDQGTGAVLYSQSTPSAIFSEPTFSNGILYFGDVGTTVWALAPTGPGGTGGGTGGGTPDGGTPDAGAPDAGTPVPTGVAFFDDFDRTSGLGSNWIIAHGSFSTDGQDALGTSAGSYAFWTGTPDPDAQVSVVLSAPTNNTYAGVVLRADPTAPDADHYCGFIAPDGTAGIARRTGWVYSILASGPVVPTGSHVLALTATGNGPVSLTLTLDGAVVAQTVDSSSAPLTSGLAGIFDYNGASQPLDKFTVSGVGSGGSPGGVDAGTPGAPDAGSGGSPDAGVVDAGAPDSGTGGTPDAGAGGGTGGGADAGTASPLFFDDFNRASLGSNWLVAHGSYVDDGSAAVAASAESYAFWTGTPDADSTVSVVVSPPASADYAGVVLRANPIAPDADHYCGFIAPDGTVGIARRTGWVYSILGSGPAFPSGHHVLALQASGTGPVSLTLWVDGSPLLQVTDASSDAITGGGLAGIFDYNGVGVPLDNFTVMPAGSSGGGGTPPPTADAGTPAPDAGTPLDGGAGADGGTPSADAGSPPPGTAVVIASDGFSGSGSLSAGWTVWNGGFSVANGLATSTAPQSYATHTPSVGGEVTVSAAVSPNGLNYSGVLARAAPDDGSRDHYCAWMDADGSVHLARRNGWNYTYLADAYPALSGTHKLELQVHGTGPVHLAVLVDQNPLLDVMDADPLALTGPGTTGIFAWQGAGSAFGSFLATQP